MLRYLLDTNIVIYVLKRRPIEVLATFNANASRMAVSSITLAELLHEWAGHDLMHTVQAERALMQPFIAGCGPWQPYFADHWIKP